MLYNYYVYNNDMHLTTFIISNIQVNFITHLTTFVSVNSSIKSKDIIMLKWKC